MQSVQWGALSTQQQNQVLSRSPLTNDPKLESQVQAIIESVQKDGANALLDLAERFDGAKPAQLLVEVASLTTDISCELKAAINTAISNVKRFHCAQQQQTLAVETMPGVNCELRTEAIESVGLYVPGGSAPLISTVIMLAVPAQIAGCQRIVLATPKLHPAIVYAAKACGVQQILVSGGAGAIAALAYGIDGLNAVDKIYGPGNRFVTMAKTLVSQDVQGAAIDMPAGPSEVLVIADGQANAAFVAADLLSQAEHGPDSQVILVTNSEGTAKSVQEQLALQLAALPRRDIALGALEHSRIIITESIDEAVKVSNRYGPEHLIIQTDNASDIVSQIRAAGSVFVGAYSPESVGDYASGTNHVLPTYGYSKTVSSLSLADFQRRFTVQTLTEEGLLNLADCVETLAAAEGLDAHKNAVTLRKQAILAGRK
ncbi:histidinol dehydrogenase [Paraferrimonas sp. SM1919]|uniref:histidinol dehydrogenase n=1 Tax=Paraferrimonas sp. SM1919 TaxID=2662263 RepID=UPI0013D41771|nr:histidinol dehydrogenase [Paraferrimonas sp. SM1919]